MAGTSADRRSPVADPDSRSSNPSAAAWSGPASSAAFRARAERGPSAVASRRHPSRSAGTCTPANAGQRGEQAPGGLLEREGQAIMPIADSHLQAVAIRAAGAVISSVAWTSAALATEPLPSMVSRGAPGTV